MSFYVSSDRLRGALCALALASLAAQVGSLRANPRMGIQETSLQLGGGYSALDPRRQKLVNDWVARFNEATGKSLEAGPFYDDYLKLSTKTTFEAVTHALLTTPLTDASSRRIGDALDD